MYSTIYNNIINFRNISNGRFMCPCVMCSAQIKLNLRANKKKNE